MPLDCVDCVGFTAIQVFVCDSGSGAGKETDQSQWRNVLGFVQLSFERSNSFDVFLPSAHPKAEVCALAGCLHQHVNGADPLQLKASSLGPTRLLFNPPLKFAPGGCTVGLYIHRISGGGAVQLSAAGELGQTDAYAPADNIEVLKGEVTDSAEPFGEPMRHGHGAAFAGSIEYELRCEDPAEPPHAKKGCAVQ